MVKFLRNWFSKTERSFLTLCLLAIVVFKLNDIYPNYVTYGLCSLVTICAIAWFVLLMYNKFKNKE